jgi:hypothetical protein
MDNALTISTLTFTGSAGTLQDGSSRREVSRGVNLPEVLTIKHTDVVDSRTKVRQRKSVVIFDRYVDTDGGSELPPVRAVLTVFRPLDTRVVSADVQAVVERHIHLLQEDDSGLNKADAIFVNEEQ